MSNIKISELTEATTPTTDDLVVIVDDPGGTPVSKKSTLANLLGVALTAIRAVTAAASKIPYFTSGSAAGLLDLDTDGTLAANSDTALASQKATKTYADTKIPKATNVTAITDTGIADGEIAVFNLSAKDIRTSNVLISTDGTLAGNADTNVPTEKATKTYADGKIPVSYLDTDTGLAADSDTKVATQKATKTYVDAQVVGVGVSTVGAADAENIVEDLSYYPPVTFTWDPGSLADGVGETSAAVPVPGVSLGGASVQCVSPYDLQGITLNAYVDAADSCKARLQNETAGTIDLASGTWIMQARRI